MFDAEINLEHKFDNHHLIDEPIDRLGDFESENSDRLANFSENLQALTTAETAHIESISDMLGLIEITLPSGDVFTGHFADLPAFIKIETYTQKQATKFGNTLQLTQDVMQDPLTLKEHIHMVIFDIIEHGDIEATQTKLQKVNNLFEQNYKLNFHVHNEAEFKIPAFHTLNKFIDQNAHLLASVRENYVALRQELEPILIAYGDTMPASVEKYLNNNPNTSNALKQLLGSMYLFGDADNNEYFNKQVATTDEIEHRSIRVLIEGEGSLPKELKSVASFILQLESEGIVNRSDPRVLALFMQDPQVSKKVSKLTTIESEKRKEVLFQWFKSFKQCLPNTLLIECKLDETINFLNMHLSTTLQNRRQTKNTSIVTARRARQLAAKHAGRELDQPSAIEDTDQKSIRMLTILPGGSWSLGGEYVDVSEFFDNKVAKLFKGSSNELVADIKSLLGELLSKGAELPAKKIEAHIKQPGTGKRLSVREVKAAELNGVPVTTRDTHGWRILYVLLDNGQPAVINIHHKDDQYETIKRFS